MKYKHYLWGLALSGLMFSFTACDKDSSSSSSNDEPSSDDPTSELTVEESKEFLEQTAIEALNLFNSADQKETITFLLDLDEAYGNLGMPENWDEDSYDYMAPAKVARKIANGLRKGNIAEVRGAIPIYTYEFSDLAGVYEPGKYNWVKTGDSKNIEFKFELQGSQCSMVITASSDYSEIREEYIDDDYPEYSEIDIVKIPKKIELTLKKGSTVMLSATATSSFDQSGKTASVNIKMTVANLVITAVGNAKDTEITDTEEVTVSGKRLFTYKLSLSGNGLCTPEKWETLQEDEPSANFINNMFKGGNASMDILGKVQVKANISKVGDIYEALDTYEEGDMTSKSECQDLCNVLNNNVLGNMYYNGSNKVEGTVVYKPAQVSEYGYKYYQPEMNVRFADGSTYSFEEFYDSFDFKTLENKLEALISSYQKIFEDWNNRGK